MSGPAVETKRMRSAGLTFVDEASHAPRSWRRVLAGHLCMRPNAIDFFKHEDTSPCCAHANPLRKWIVVEDETAYSIRSSIYSRPEKGLSW